MTEQNTQPDEAMVTAIANHNARLAEAAQHASDAIAEHAATEQEFADKTETETETAKVSEELSQLIDMVRTKKTAPAAQVGAPAKKGKGKTSAVAPAPSSAPKADAKPEEKTKVVDDTTKLFSLGKIPPNVRGFRGYARAQLVHLSQQNSAGFTQKQFRDALVSNAAGVEAPGEPTVGWAKHNFPTWCAANAWIVPFAAALATVSAPTEEEPAH